MLFDGNIEKHLRRLAAVGQCKEFVSDFDVFFDLLSEGCAFFTELELDDLTIRIDLWFADPSISLEKLNSLDR